MASSTLATLALENNRIGSNGAIALSEALRTNSILTTLELEDDSIGVDGIQALSEALKTNSTLTTLSLKGNSIAYEWVEPLSEALKTNSTLTTLDLANNSLGAEGAVALSEALKTNSTLTTLDLMYNSIGDDGTVALSEALKINSTLTTLGLEENGIDDDGSVALSEALKTNSTLTTLNLARNWIGENGVVALSEAFKMNSTLITLNLLRNTIGKRGTVALSKLIALAAEVAKHDEKFQRVKGVKGGVKVPRSVKKPTVWQRQNTGLAGRSNRHDSLSSSLPEDPEGQTARKTALERKAKMYEMLKRSGGEDIPEKLKEELLVEFDDPRRSRGRGRGRDPRDYKDDPWVEHVDEFGRSRLVRQSEIPSPPIPEPVRNYQESPGIHNPANPFPVFRNQEAIDKQEWIRDATGEMIQATSGRGSGGPGYSQANTVRHYDNATERRARGVGFYAFSQDEDERARQMRELLEMRNQTETSRSKHRTLKDKRRDEIEARKILIQQKRLKSLASTVAS
ncbi:hypothetical protein BGZ95_005334 [Linnemannia exigua]|uniref:CCDC174 alpha/beta GRSR domain-containing protein n=1 Tax=Linnemannia exigua TaxID=604196 RepID=A0AAD4DH85_9FUNG|nr:hypothetical protein BGZ95_005334 [Linnemannia exigua]